MMIYDEIRIIANINIIMELKITKNLSNKNNTELINFYKNHNNNNNFIDYKKKINNNLLLCSYNVHGWININADIDIVTNFQNILNLLSKLDIDILILQEVCFHTVLTEEYIIKQFTNNGYIDHFVIENGGCYLKKNKSDYIVILSKKKINTRSVIDTTCLVFKRCTAIITLDNIKFAFLHLEIGKRYHHLIDGKQKRIIEKDNGHRRIEQLKKIFNTNSNLNDCKSIDIIVGDFNFSFQDPEFIWLLEQNFYYYGDCSNTTPYNRTDMLFINQCTNIKYVYSTSINCNYSDHLPILCELGN